MARIPPGDPAGHDVLRILGQRTLPHGADELLVQEFVDAELAGLAALEGIAAC
jgi:hypothetical protein